MYLRNIGVGRQRGPLYRGSVQRPSPEAWVLKRTRPRTCRSLVNLHPALDSRYTGVQPASNLTFIGLHTPEHPAVTGPQHHPEYQPQTEEEPIDGGRRVGDFQSLGAVH